MVKMTKNYVGRSHSNTFIFVFNYMKTPTVLLPEGFYRYTIRGLG